MPADATREPHAMTDQADDILDDLFHGCALTAWLMQAAEQQGWPDSAATRERAYAYYEEALAQRHAAKRRTADPSIPRPAVLSSR